MYLLAVAGFLLMVAYGIIDFAWKRLIQKLSYLPAPPTLPFLGVAPYLKFDPHKLYRQLLEFADQFDRLYVLWIGIHPVIISGRVEYAEAILSSQKILTKSTFYQYLEEWLGTGLLTSSGKKWKTRRRLITPSFHFAILNDFVSIFEEHAKRLVQKLNVEADTCEAIDIQMPVSLAALDIISETSMGVKVNAQDASDSEYVKALNSMNENLQLRQRSPWLWPDFIYRYTSSGKIFYKSLNILHKFTVGVINKRIASRKANKQTDEIISKEFKVRTAFLDMLLDVFDKGEIDIDGIKEEVDTFMFEGHDTTAAGLSWTLYLLGKHPEVQEKLHAEIDHISHKNVSILGKIRDLKYLEFVIKESLRLHPPVPLYGRVLEEDTVIDGNVVPKGTQIAVDAMALHTNPKYWENPFMFYPERFGEEKFAKRDPYVYVPFSAGPRNCIGQKFAMLEEKVLLYFIMSKFRLKSVQEYDEIQTCVEIIQKSNNGLWIEFYSR